MFRSATTPKNLVLEWLSHSSIRRYAARLLRDPASVDDVLQNVAEKLLSGSVDIEQPERYAKRAVRNAAIDYQRAASVRENYESRHCWSSEPFAHSAEADLAAAGLQQTICNLPVVTAEIFRQHYFDGKSQHEIAEALGLHLSSVEKRLAQARRACMRSVAPEDD